MTQGEPTHGLTLSAWIGFGLVLAALIVAAILAYRRSRHGAVRTASRYRRLAYATGAFAIPMTTALWAHLLLEQDAVSKFDFAVGAGLLAGAPLLLFGSIELIFGLWGPERTRMWILLGPPTFAAATMAALALSGLAIGQVIHLTPRLLMPIAASLAAGLVWWCFLPSDLPEVVGVFD